MIQSGLNYLDEETRRVQNYTNRALSIMENSFKLATTNILTAEVRNNLDLRCSDEEDLMHHGDLSIHEFLENHGCSLGREAFEQGLMPYNEEHLIHLLVTTENYLTRKYIFENICSRYCTIFEPIRGVNYSQNVDYILGLYLKRGDVEFENMLKRLKQENYSQEQSHKFFQIFALLFASNRDASIDSIEDDCFTIIENHKDQLKYMDEELLLQYLHSKEINPQKVYKKSERQYIKIPQIISGSYGENSGVINLLSGFIKSHYPSIYKDSRKKKQLVTSVLNDGKKIKLVSSALEKSSKYVHQKCGSYITKAKKGYNWGKDKSQKGFRFIGDTSFKLWLQGGRNLRSTYENEIDFQDHEQILRQHIDFKSYLKSIESSQQVNKSAKNTRGGSAVYGYIHNKYKAKFLAPIVNGIWNRIMTLKIARSVTTSAKVVKFKNLVWILTYLGIEQLKSGIATMQFAKNYKTGKQSYNGFPIENNPILLRLFLENSEDIDIISTRINQVSELKKLNKISRELRAKQEHLDELMQEEFVQDNSREENLLTQIKDQDVAELEDETVSCIETRREETRLEIELLSLEIRQLKEKLHGEGSNNEKVKNKEIRREIREKFSRVLIETHDHLNSALIHN